MANSASGPREHWNSQVGFVAAAIGSAVGLGNMWRFSYLTAEQGGAAFVALYLLFTITLGLPVMLSELVIGRGSGKSPVEALAHYGGPGWRALGVAFVAAGFLILSYYSVIAGWTLRFAGEAAFTGFAADSAKHFDAISQGSGAMLFHVLFMGITVAVVYGGVHNGIERLSVVAMPALFVLVIGIAVYGATLPGASAGYTYYLNVDVSKAMSMNVVVSAAGQAFFSLSLGMGAMLTYASYLPPESHLPRESAMIAGADFFVAFIAGLMVFPLVFALGIQGDVGESTIGALFVALPKAFAGMGGAGRVVGLCFFLTLVVGALTSAISLLEVVVAATMDGLGWPRHRATLVTAAAITAFGAFAAFNLSVLDVMDQVANNLFLIGGGLGLAIFTGWVMKDPIAEARVGAELGVLPVWRFCLRFVVPAVLVVVLWNSVPQTLEAVAGLFGG